MQGRSKSETKVAENSSWFPGEGNGFGQIVVCDHRDGHQQLRLNDKKLAKFIREYSGQNKRAERKQDNSGQIVDNMQKFKLPLGWRNWRPAQRAAHSKHLDKNKDHRHSDDKCK